MTTNTTPNDTTNQPIACVSRGALKMYVMLLSEKGGLATYCCGDPRDATEVDTYTRPIAEFRDLYAPASSLRR